MSKLEVNEKPKNPEISSPSSVIDLLVSESANKSIGEMTRDSKDTHLHPVTFFKQGSLSHRNDIVKDLSREIKKAGRLELETEAGEIVVDGIKHQLKFVGAAAADSLATDISKKLPDGMQLKIEQNAKLNARVDKLVKDGVIETPDYVRNVELIAKDGASLGKFSLAISSSGQRLATELGKEKKLDATGAEARNLLKEMQDQFDYGGTKSVDKLAADVSSKLPNGMKLKLIDDEAFRKDVEQTYKKRGDPIPDYMRVVELLDRDGKSLGKVGVTLYEKKREPEVIRNLT
jgi:hypothetical protein